ncbi:K1586 ligase, partial [Atractosteus spatula]|nr:K1586 ligase [Atractosteus spatula]
MPMKILVRYTISWRHFPEALSSRAALTGLCVFSVCVKEALKEYVLMSFVASLHNPSNQVKYLESQVLIAMGQKGYLGLGGTVLALEYIVKNCALADDTTQAEQSVSSSTVRQSFEAVLACWCADDSVAEKVVLICSKCVDELEAGVACVLLCSCQMLWPYLLNFLTWRSYSNALLTLCQNLSVLHRRLREKSPSFLSDFDELDFLASPDIFMVRLLLGASQPHRGGRECLSLLQSLGPVIHPQLPSVWEPLIPPLARISQIPHSTTGQICKEICLREHSAAPESTHVEIYSMLPVGNVIRNHGISDSFNNLIIYMRCDGKGDVDNVFLDITELTDGTDTDSIYSCLRGSLSNLGFDDEFMKKYLISIATDGAAVHTGKSSGLTARLKHDFPKVQSIHCLAHRRELAVQDALKEVAGCNRFEFFIAKLYSLYHQSTKNARMLEKAAADLTVQILKTGQILNIRWVASSFNTVKAVWKDFPALAHHFALAGKLGALEGLALRTACAIMPTLRHRLKEEDHFPCLCPLLLTVCVISPHSTRFRRASTPSQEQTRRNSPSSVTSLLRPEQTLPECFAGTEAHRRCNPDSLSLKAKPLLRASLSECETDTLLREIPAPGSSRDPSRSGAAGLPSALLRSVTGGREPRLRSPTRLHRDQPQGDDRSSDTQPLTNNGCAPLAPSAERAAASRSRRRRRRRALGAATQPIRSRDQQGAGPE